MVNGLLSITQIYINITYYYVSFINIFYLFYKTLNMYGLTNEQKIDFIIKKSKQLGITSYDYGQNTSLSDLGARNILNRISKNPRSKNLDIMIKYLEDKMIESGSIDRLLNEINEEPEVYNPVMASNVKQIIEKLLSRDICKDEAVRFILKLINQP